MNMTSPQQEVLTLINSLKAFEFSRNNNAGLKTIPITQRRTGYSCPARDSEEKSRPYLPWATIHVLKTVVPQPTAQHNLDSTGVVGQHGRFPGEVRAVRTHFFSATEHRT
jgi:hypothetical protein